MSVYIIVNSYNRKSGGTTHITPGFHLDPLFRKRAVLPPGGSKLPKLHIINLKILDFI